MEQLFLENFFLFLHLFFSLYISLSLFLTRSLSLPLTLRFMNWNINSKYASPPALHIVRRLMYKCFPNLLYLLQWNWDVKKTTWVKLYVETRVLSSDVGWFLKIALNHSYCTLFKVLRKSGCNQVCFLDVKLNKQRFIENSSFQPIFLWFSTCIYVFNKIYFSTVYNHIYKFCTKFSFLVQWYVPGSRKKK